MSCRDIQDLRQGYLDGELDLTGSLKVEQHLQDCQACAREHQNQKTLRTALSDSSLYFCAPAQLEKRLKSSLRKTIKAEPESRPSPWRWIFALGSAVVAAILVAGLLFFRPAPARDDLLAQEMVSAHVRSLMASHLTDVTSTNQHTVKPWFDGKLDFSPQVIDLANQGFVLVGGRLDYIGKRPVAALVYQRRQHFINLFVWPETGADSGANKMSEQQGYNLVHWNKAGMVYWAVSDLNINELQEFAQAQQAGG